MKTGFIVAVFSLLVVAVFALLGVREKTRLKSKIDTLEQRIAELEAAASAPRPKPAAESKENPRSESILAKSSVGVEDPFGADDAEAPEEAKKGGNMFEGFAKMFESPEMQKMLEGQQRMQIEKEISPFLADLGLGDEEKDALKQLILERDSVSAKLGMKLMNKDLSDKERTTIASEIAAERKRINNQIQEQMGEEAFDEFELFEKSQPEREALKSYRETLQADGLDLSVEQEEKLMAAMYEERTQAPHADMFDESEPGKDFEALRDTEGVSAFLEGSRVTQERINERAENILDEKQFERFRDHQEAQFQMQEMGIRMGMQFMGRDQEVIVEEVPSP